MSLPIHHDYHIAIIMSSLLRHIHHITIIMSPPSSHHVTIMSPPSFQQYDIMLITLPSSSSPSKYSHKYLRINSPLRVSCLLFSTVLYARYTMKTITDMTDQHFAILSDLYAYFIVIQFTSASVRVKRDRQTHIVHY